MVVYRAAAAQRLPFPHTAFALWRVRQLGVHFLGRHLIVLMVQENAFREREVVLLEDAVDNVVAGVVEFHMVARSSSPQMPECRVHRLVANNAAKLIFRERHDPVGIVNQVVPVCGHRYGTDILFKEKAHRQMCEEGRLLCRAQQLNPLASDHRLGLEFDLIAGSPGEVIQG